jgi:hypothetical protein
LTGLKNAYVIDVLAKSDNFRHDKKTSGDEDKIGILSFGSRHA